MSYPQARYCIDGCGRTVRYAKTPCRDCAAMNATPPVQDWSWREQAACYNSRDACVFPQVDAGRGKTVTAQRQEFIRRFCGHCPVRVECRLEGVAIAREYGIKLVGGIWGGQDFARRKLSEGSESNAEWLARLGLTLQEVT